MGSSASDLLVEQEKPFWEQPHTLQIDVPLRNQQRAMLASLGGEAKLCRTSRKLFGVPVQHWYITDGNYTIEFGDATMSCRSLHIFASTPRRGQVIVKEFQMTDEVKRRLRAVCGATNHSLALRNSEHMAKYIAIGRWNSLQMVGTSPMFEALKRDLGEQQRLINTLPAELVEVPRDPTAPGLIHSDLKSPFAVEFGGIKQTLAADDNGVNMVVLGPTGAGKSSIINTLFNRKVAKVKASAHSVTQHMEVYSGSFVYHGGVKRVNFNVIDSIGFCDSVIPPQEVLQIVKGYIMSNVLEVSKVIVVCSSRIEKAQGDAIKNFMQWLEYSRHKSEFVFLYNKAEHMDEEEREEVVTDMCTLLGADPTHSVTHRLRSDEWKQVRYALAVGFPPRAPLVQVKCDLDALYEAVFLFRSSKSPIRVSASNCQIL